MSIKTREKSDGIVLPPMIQGRLVKRYKRFLADVDLDDGGSVTAHCPNSGSMKGCALPGHPVWLSTSGNPKRKYPHTWELIKTPDTYIGINTMVPNRLVKLGCETGQIPGLTGYESVQAEVKTSSHTRLDLKLTGSGRRDCYVEIKNCTLVEEGTAMFPDAVTTRGQKHLKELQGLVAQGHRGVIFFLIQRMDARVFRPADSIDPVYGKILRQVAAAGVEVMAMDTQIDTGQICINAPVAVDLAL